MFKNNILAEPYRRRFVLTEERMKREKKKIIITVDGYSSCGKSTFAKAIATELGYIYIDSGAMYRAVTLFALRHGLVEDGVADERADTGSYAGDQHHLQA